MLKTKTQNLKSNLRNSVNEVSLPAKKKTIRIAHFHCSYVYSGGGERISLKQVLGLRKRGYQVDSFAPAVNRKNCFPDLIKEVSPYKIIPDLPEWFPARDAFDMGLSSLLIPFLFWRFRKYDLFIGANQPGAWFAYCLSKMLGKPYLVYLNQPNRMIYPRKIDLNTGWTTNRNFLLLEKIIHIFHPVVRYLDRLSVRNASFLLANGRYIGDIIEQIYAKEYTDCPAGSDPFDKTEIIDNSNEIYSGKLRINGFEVKKPYILLTNRHYPQKKFEYALEALTIVKRVIPSVTLAISGAFTSYTEKLRQLAEKLKVSKEVVFLGEVDDKLMAEIYRNAAVYVYTSPEEDYGMGVVEAENAGVPVVAWNHAGPTVTIRDRETGFLAKPYQVDDFSDKVMKLLKDKNLRMNMGKKAHENVQRYFTWEAHLDILERATLVSLKSNGRKKRRRRKN